jgi:4-hydroxy-tetrahydrodipicolinate synthase
MAVTHFEGVYANLPTPFTDGGDQLDFVRLHRLLDFLLESGVQGVACSLSSGEYPYLSHEERKRLATEVACHVAGHVPVLVGVSAITTSEAIAFTVHAEEIGADAAMVMPLQYWPLKPYEVIAYFRDIAEASSLPLGIYDNPGLNGARFSIDMYATLAAEARVTLSKDSSGEIIKVFQVVQACAGRVAVLHGNHMEMLAAYLYGAAGVCTAIASVFPLACCRIDRLARSHEWEAAREAFHEVEPVFRFFHEHSLARCVKEASEILGRSVGPQRKPLSGLPGAERKMLEQLLASHHVLGEVR